MHPDKVNRLNLTRLTDLPNVGKAVAADLRQLGYTHPGKLQGRDPLALYHQLCEQAGQRIDPCMLDVLIAISRFLDGEPPRPWWHYTAERKERFPQL